MKLTNKELKEMIMQEIAEANEKISTKKTSTYAKGMGWKRISNKIYGRNSSARCLE